MVFLDHRGIVQAEPVVAAGAGTDRVLLRVTQTRQRFAGIEHACAGALQRCDICRCRGRGGGQGLQEIERAALGAQQCPQIGLHRANGVSGSEPLALVA